MARTTFVKSSRKPIYRHGLQVTKTKKTGSEYQSRDRSQPATDREDEILVEKGSSYYWWQFRNGGKNVSMTRPKQSQLTQNAFKGEAYALNEQIDDIEWSDDLGGEIEEIVSSIDSLIDENQEKMDNMPEQFQGTSSAWEILEARGESLEEWKTNLEDLDFDSKKEEVDGVDNDADLDDEEKEESKNELIEDFMSDLKEHGYQGD